MKTTIKRITVGEYLIENIEINTAYEITHLDNQEPKIIKI